MWILHIWLCQKTRTQPLHSRSDHPRPQLSERDLGGTILTSMVVPKNLKRAGSRCSYLRKPFNAFPDPTQFWVFLGTESLTAFSLLPSPILFTAFSISISWVPTLKRIQNLGLQWISLLYHTCEITYTGRCMSTLHTRVACDLILITSFSQIRHQSELSMAETLLASWTFKKKGCSGATSRCFKY